MSMPGEFEKCDQPDLSQIYHFLRQHFEFGSGTQQQLLEKRRHLSEFYKRHFHDLKKHGETRKAIATELDQQKSRGNIDTALSGNFQSDFGSFSKGQLDSKKTLAIIAWCTSRKPSLLYDLAESCCGLSKSAVETFFRSFQMRSPVSHSEADQYPDKVFAFWSLREKPNKPFNPLLASFELSQVQGSGADGVVRLLPSIYLNGIVDAERGFKLRFMTAELLVELFPEEFAAEFDRPENQPTNEDENWPDTSHEIVRRKYHELLRIIAKGKFLEGHYEMKQNAIFPIRPLQSPIEFSAKLLVATDYENLICPKDMEITNNGKLAIITQMIIKGSLPSYDSSQGLVLHKATYEIAAEEELKK